ncbi:MAG: hypothetical protein ACK5C6_02320 [Roseiflexaceae bacterium]
MSWRPYAPAHGAAAITPKTAWHAMTGSPSPQRHAMADTAVASFRQGALISVFTVEKMAPAHGTDAMTGRAAQACVPPQRHAMA